MSTHFPWKMLITLSPVEVLFNPQNENVIHTLTTSSFSDEQLESIEPVYLNHFIKLLQNMCKYYINQYHNAYYDKQLQMNTEHELQITRLNSDKNELQDKNNMLQENLVQSQRTISTYRNVVMDLQNKLDENKRHYKSKVRELKTNLQHEHDKQLLEKLNELKTEFTQFNTVRSYYPHAYYQQAYTSVNDKPIPGPMSRTVNNSQKVNKSHREYSKVNKEDVNRMFSDLTKIENKLHSSQRKIKDRLIDTENLFDVTKKDIIKEVEDLKEREKDNYYNSCRFEDNKNVSSSRLGRSGTGQQRYYSKTHTYKTIG